VTAGAADGRRFRSARWMQLVCLVSAGALVAIQVRTDPTSHPVRFWLASSLCVIAVAALVESLVSFIHCGPAVLTVRRLLTTKSYRREDVAGVSWEKGSSVTLRLADGSWAALPSLGHSNPSVAGAVRAWLNERAS
jgi:hypothetical protein